MATLWSTAVGAHSERVAVWTATDRSNDKYKFCRIEGPRPFKSGNDIQVDVGYDDAEGLGYFISIGGEFGPRGFQLITVGDLTVHSTKTLLLEKQSLQIVNALKQGSVFSYEYLEKKPNSKLTFHRTKTFLTGNFAKAAAACEAAVKPPSETSGREGSR